MYRVLIFTLIFLTAQSFSSDIPADTSSFPLSKMNNGLIKATILIANTAFTERRYKTAVKTYVDTIDNIDMILEKIEMEAESVTDEQALDVILGEQTLSASSAEQKLIELKMYRSDMIHYKKEALRKLALIYQYGLTPIKQIFIAEQNRSKQKSEKVPKNISKAKKYLQQAIDLGDLPSLNALDALKEKGKGKGKSKSVARSSRCSKVFH